MNLVVFGLSISSAWGNGHATLLRGLFRALHSQGTQIDFFEKDTPYYSAHRDCASFPFVNLHIYQQWDEALPRARRCLENSDAALVTSYCSDGEQVFELLASSRVSRKVFYDMDTPVTLKRLQAAEKVDYLPEGGLRDFDLVLSFTGGDALPQLREKLGARRVEPLYGWVDPEVHYRSQGDARFAADLCYLGTYAPDRQSALHDLLIQPARELPEKQFVIGGAMFPASLEVPSNVRSLGHVVPADHSAFFGSSPLTLNVTRESMAAFGYCPSGRLFEAAACGTPILSDWWPGLDTFFEPGREILVSQSVAEAASAITMPSAELAKIGSRARDRVLEQHTAAIRARQLTSLIEMSNEPAFTPDRSNCQGANQECGELSQQQV